MTTIILNDRVVLIGVSLVCAIRGCSAEDVADSIGDALHPKGIRWAFNLSINPKGRCKALRIWRNEILSECNPGFPKVDKFCSPRRVIDQILGTRQNFPRGEIERQWVLSAQTILRFVRDGEIKELNHQITRASLAALLERRLV